MKLNALFLVLLAAGGAGCDQQQTKLLECERQLQAKDKAIGELARTNSDLLQRLEARPQDSITSEKIEDIVTASVTNAMEQQNAGKLDEMKRQLEEISRKLQAGTPVANQTGERGVTPPPATPSNTNPKDPSRVRIPMEFKNRQ